MYIKELFVDEKFRGLKIGELLMKAVSAEAKDLNCFSIKWTVAPWNEDGMRFYERLGAKQNTEWINYELSEEDFSTLILSE
jgi:GNAT superfamily N-acetyltransferase